MVRSIFDVLDTVNRQGTTILLVEHKARRALALAGRGSVLEHGAVTVAGARAGLLAPGYVPRAPRGM